MMEIIEAPANPFAQLLEGDIDADYKPGAGRPDIDYEPFRRLPRPRSNADYISRYNRIRELFPSVDFGPEQWRQIFRDRPGIFRAICVELIEVDSAIDKRPGRPGRHPQLSSAEMTRRLLRLFGQEYSFLAFPDAFKVLCGTRTVRAVAAKTGLPRSTIHKLLNSQIEPTAKYMEDITKGFGAHPSYFLEWRTAYVVAALHDRMADNPETSTSLYRKLLHSTG